MKKMSKLAALLMTAVMLFSFWGCNNAASNATPEDIAEESANPPAGTETNTDNQNPGNNASASLPEELTTPLTLEAITDGIIKIYCPWTTLKYKINDGSLTNVQIQYPVNDEPYTEITVQAGDKVSLFASGSENRDGYNDYYIQNIRLSCADPDDEAEFYVYGNVMSLLDATNYATKKNIEKEMSFAYLFSDGFVNLKTHATKKLVLPATTLKEYCYTGMFRGCEVLEKAPELPATVLAPHCYEEMFSDCYELTTAPELPAAILVESCYEDMFDGCEKLNYVKCLATDYSAEDCIDDWLSDVAETGTFVKAAEANISRSEIGLPDGWSIQGATKYSITINNSEHGTVSVNKTTAEESEIIKLTVNSEEGYILDTLDVKTDSNGKVKGDDVSFLMPAENVSITASFKIDTSKSYSINVSGGAAVFGSNGIMSGKAGSEYDLKAIIPVGKEFVKWTTTTEGVIITDVNAATTKFTMPPRNVEIVASFKDKIYSIFIVNGTANPSTAKYNDIVTITADDAPEGKEFDKWESTPEITFEGSNAIQASFKMPAEDVAISVVYKNSYIGTKKNPTEVGDIIFNDGSALPATVYNTRELTNLEKQNAIAIVAYVNMVNGNPDKCLAVGLKQTRLMLCDKSSQGDTNTTVFSCDNSSLTRDYICNGKDNIITDYGNNGDDYPAMHWAQTYKGFSNLGTFKTDWLIPSKTELLKVYDNKSAVITASEKIGKSYATVPFVNETTSHYLTVTQGPEHIETVYRVDFSNGNCDQYQKFYLGPVLAIRYFQCHD